MSRFSATFLSAIFFGALVSASAFALPPLKPRIARNTGILGIQGSGYFTNSDTTLADERIGNIGLTGEGRGYHSGDFLEVEGQISSLLGLRKANYRYLAVPEAYAATVNPTYKFYFGRHITEWSALDDYWMLGVWQPRFRWDYLQEEDQGLTGLFFTYNEPNASLPIEFKLFASPLNIPEQSAPVDIVNGNCKTVSPWFSCPGSTVLLFNKPTTIKFQIDMPPIRKLITHFGLATSLRIGTEGTTFARLSYARKPINQVLLAYEGRLDLSTFNLPATIHPRIFNHELYTFETGHAFRQGTRLLASVTRERPLRDFTPIEWNTQEVAPAWFGGLIAYIPVSEQTMLEASVFHRDGGNADDKGPFAGTLGSVFEPRYPFHNAVSATIRTSVRKHWLPYFNNATRFVWDKDFDGNILSSDFRFLPTRPLRFNFGFDILGSRNPSNVDFIARYQRNDRVRGGMEYVF